MRRHLHQPRLALLIVATTLMLLAAHIGGSLLRDAAAAPRDRGRDGRGLCALSVKIALAANARLDTALSGLVADGTLTQDQADAVVSRLTDPDLGTSPSTPATTDAGTRREIAANRAARCAAAAQNARATAEAVSALLGLEPSEIRARLAAGESLAEIADSEGVSRGDLIAALQTGALARLDAAEAAGALTAEDRAAREAASLTRIESLIDISRGDRRIPEPASTPPAT